jgi:hypothetical protein
VIPALFHFALARDCSLAAKDATSASADCGHTVANAYRRSVPIADVSRCSKLPLYSMTSSARASSCAGKSRPSALAVLRLMTSSYFVGACTGRSAGFAPRRMRST